MFFKACSNLKTSSLDVNQQRYSYDTELYFGIKLMKTIHAKIKLYSGTGKRKTPFFSGYRPLFDLLSNTMISGAINFLDRKFLEPGSTAVVEITFLTPKSFIKDSFFFYESNEPLGEGVILNLVE